MSQPTNRAQLQQWFRQIDADKSGALDVMELQRALSLGGLTFSLKTVQAVMRLHDRDMNGTIDFDEFERLHIWLVSICATFRLHDANNDGSLDRAEAALALAAYRLDPPALEALFCSFDPDRSQSLCLVEYVALVVCLEGARRTFNAFDRQGEGRISLNFSQSVYFVSNAF